MPDKFNKFNRQSKTSSTVAVQDKINLSSSSACKQGPMPTHNLAAGKAITLQILNVYSAAKSQLLSLSLSPNTYLYTSSGLS